MCLILLAYRAHRRYPLVLVANRDEWFHRPTAPAHFWADRPAILAGRDLEQRGTWLGLSRGGRFGAITNYRDPGAQRTDLRSRGHIVSAFLERGGSPGSFGAALAAEGDAYNGFNFLGGTLEELVWYSNRAQAPESVAPGVHGLSNHLLNTDWPKVVEGKARLSALVAGDEMEPARLFELLDDRRAHPAENTAPAWERGPSAAHIVAQPRVTASGETSWYGTRSSTVILIDAGGAVDYAERTFDVEGRIANVVAERFALA